MAKRQLKGFLYSIGINAEDFPLASKLRTSFYDGNRKPIKSYFYPFDNILKNQDVNNFLKYLFSIEKDLKKGITVNIDSIQITDYSVTINPFSPQHKVFMRDV